MTKYAKDTEVSVERSRVEIESTLRKYGCHDFGYMSRRDGATVQFVLEDRMIRFTLPLPSPDDPKFAQTETGRRRHDPIRAKELASKGWEQACRQRWRALSLTIKAKLEAVECGITSLEQEFLAHIVLANGQTFGDWAAPQLALAGSSRMPMALPEHSSAS